MAAEEFQHSDLFFSGDHPEFADHRHRQGTRRRPFSRNKKQKKSSRTSSSNSTASSVPVDIPANHVFRIGDYEEDDHEYEYEYEEGAGGLVPPHVILGRRMAGKMAFSVCTGNGRTLKGRDLSQVRNSILRMTGFLET